MSTGGRNIKIAHTKNNGHELSIIAKIVDSNYFLLNKILTPKYENAGFLALSAEPSAASATALKPCLSDLLRLYRKIRTVFQNEFSPRIAAGGGAAKKAGLD